MRYRKNTSNSPWFTVALIVALFACVAFSYWNQQKNPASTSWETRQSPASTSWNYQEASTSPETKETKFAYALNTNTMKIHKPTCSSVFEMADHNRQWTNKSIEELEREGYTKCKRCF